MAKITQSEFIRHYNEKNREQFNPVYFERNNQDIMDCVRKVILSCEKDKYFTLQVKSIREIYNYEEIYNMLRAYQESHKKKNVIVENQYDYINIMLINCYPDHTEYTNLLIETPVIKSG